MFFLYGMLQDGDALNPLTNNNVIDTVSVSNGIYGHLNLLDKISTANNVFDMEKPTTWTEDTLLDCTFNDTINGGEISAFAGYVDRLEIQRKEKDTDTWVTLQNIRKDPVTGILNTVFRFIDPYAKNNTIYDYQIVSIDNNGNTGFAFQSEILSRFERNLLVDADHIYDATIENSYSSDRNQVAAVYQPYGSKYPFVAYNAVINYDSGQITTILMAPTSQNRTVSYIDRQGQVDIRKEFNAWLTNGKVKAYKDFNGEFKLITVANNVTNSFYKELGNGLCSTTFNYIEVGDFSQKSLDKLNITDNFFIQFGSN